MTMSEACELAQAIEGNGQFAVVAIGRFVMTNEINHSSKQSLPWKISVVSLADPTDRTVIFNEAEWQSFCKAVSKPVKETSKPVKGAKETRPVVDEHQLELF